MLQKKEMWSLLQIYFWKNLKNIIRSTNIKNISQLMCTKWRSGKMWKKVEKMLV
jgi:hypothetical protein